MPVLKKGQIKIELKGIEIVDATTRRIEIAFPDLRRRMGNGLAFMIRVKYPFDKDDIREKAMQKRSQFIASHKVEQTIREREELEIARAAAFPEDYKDE